MSATTVHHAYNDVVATHYDLDPQGIIGRSLDLGVRQLEEEGLLDPERRWRVLDLGNGDGPLPRQAQGAGRRSDRAIRDRPGREHAGGRPPEAPRPRRRGRRCRRAGLLFPGPDVRLRLHAFRHRVRTDGPPGAADRPAGRAGRLLVA